MPTLRTYLDPIFTSTTSNTSVTASPSNLASHPENTPSLSPPPSPPPPFRHDTPNVILMYYGSFNPPHTNHLALLRIAAQFTRNLHVVGTLIWPMADRYVRAKYRLRAAERSGAAAGVAEEDSLLLTQSQRAALWRSDARVLTGVWVVEEGMLAPYDDDDGDVDTDLGVVFNWVTEAAAYDGFAVQWMDVMGADRFERRCREGRVGKGGNEGRGMVVTDVGRRVESLFDQEARLRELEGYGAWERVKVQTGQGREREGTTTTSGQSARTRIKGDDDEETIAAATVWWCSSILRPKCEVQFIATDRSFVVNEVSSTAIRRMIKQDTGTRRAERLIRELRQVVLSQDLFEDIIRTT